MVDLFHFSSFSSTFSIFPLFFLPHFSRFETNDFLVESPGGEGTLLRHCTCLQHYCQTPPSSQCFDETFHISKFTHLDSVTLILNWNVKNLSNLSPWIYQMQISKSHLHVPGISNLKWSFNYCNALQYRLFPELYIVIGRSV